ncbi:GIY-YIG nuclease family protein [Azospirillum sp. SYSU D00513]|uniref:GIY-YIG nuclease family protein n=1 Tax=Azospirillum sp. SYSU D00513 TaxID=2812561 RepID=UPI001A96B034|nr:GIY-YIG nuclease family protein [Azospirillum sp. SYSU D00513]
MKTEDKKAAVAAYKERKISAGIYALRCAPTGEVWVGAAPDLGTIQNRLWFQLRLNGSPYRELQAAWNRHGADSITFEVLEPLDEETAGYALGAALKARARHWTETLNARLI